MVQEDAASCRLRSNRKAGGIAPHGAHGGQSKPREDGDDEAREPSGAEREETVQTRTTSPTPSSYHRGGPTRKESGAILLLLAAFACVTALSLSRADMRLGRVTVKESANNPTLTPTAKLGFPWDRIDPSIDGKCGMNKCFFRHVNSRDGIIVSFGENLFLGWERGLALEKDYGLKQPCYQEHPPQIIHVPFRKIHVPSRAGTRRVRRRNRGRKLSRDIRKKMKRHGGNRKDITFSVAPHQFIEFVYGKKGAPTQSPSSTLPEDESKAYSLGVAQLRYIDKPHLEYP